MPVLKNTFIDSPYRLIIRGGETLNTVVKFEEIDSNDLVTGPYDFSDWDDEFWCAVTGGTSTSTPLAYLTVTKEDAAGGELLHQLSSRDTRIVQQSGYLSGWGDLYGRLSGLVLLVGNIVWQIDQGVTDSQPLDGNEVGDPPDIPAGG